MFNENTSTLSNQLDSIGGTLLPKEFSIKQCLLEVEEEPNQIIEKLYGPFSVPNIFRSRKPEIDLKKHQLEIMQLKKVIKERERLQFDLIRVRRETSAPVPVITKPPVVEELAMSEPENDHSVVIPEPNESLRDEQMHSKDDSTISDDDESQQTPTVDPQVIAVLQQELSRLDKMIEEKEEKLKQHITGTEELRVKLLGLQVKLSIERNRKETKRSKKLIKSHKRDRKAEESSRRVKKRTESYPFAIAHFHQQIPYVHQPNYLLPSHPPPLYYRPSQDIDFAPPPPPASPPPPPPPPPPPMNDIFLPDRQLMSREEEEDTRISMHDGTAVNYVLQEIQQLISLRMSNLTDVERTENRPLPRTPILITIDGYTMIKKMILVDQNQNLGISNDFKNIPNNNESPFFALLIGKAMGENFDESMDEFANHVLSCIPSDINLHQPETVFPTQLMEALDYVRKESAQDPSNECKAALKAELSFFVHGQSDALYQECEETIKTNPLCLDVYWQQTRSKKPLNSIRELIHTLARLRQRFDTAQSQRISNMNVEILTRTLKIEDGLTCVLELLMNANEKLETETMQVFSLDDMTHLYLTEQDKYRMWMILLYYYVTRQVPDNICQSWISTLVKTGKAQTEKPIFMIDWTPALENKPLGKQEQVACVNIMLSMLRHFGNKAHHDISRRPLLIGTLRTLFNFLSLSSSYKVAGTLILARKAMGLEGLQPEIQEIVIDLELKTNNSLNSVASTIQQDKKKRRSLTLGYQIASRLRCNINEKEDLYAIANVLGSCIGCLPNANEETLIRVDKIRQSYLTTLGLDMLDTTEFLKLESNTVVRSCSFAWLNLLVLLQISKLLYIENSVIRDTLVSQMDLVLNGARQNIKTVQELEFIQDYTNTLKKSFV